MAYWRFKSEPSCFSFADLMSAPDRTTGWDGVRNYQARNSMRGDMKIGSPKSLPVPLSGPPRRIIYPRVSRDLGRITPRMPRWGENEQN